MPDAENLATPDFEIQEQEPAVEDGNKVEDDQQQDERPEGNA